MLDIGEKPADNTVIAALHPFRQERETHRIASGHTIAEIFEIIQPDPVLRRAAHVYIGNQYIRRENWHLVRPKPGAQIAVRAFIPPTGGGGGKDILRTVLLIAVVASALILGPALGAALGFSGALAASVGQAVIGIGGMLIVNALVPPRGATVASNESDSQTKFIESAQNAANPFGPVPVVFGRNKQIPNLGAEWITEIVGDDQYLRGILVWGVAPLDIDPTQFKLGDTLLSAFTDFEIQTYDGYSNFDALTLYPSTVDQQNFQITLLHTDPPTIRTTDDNADEISVDWVFASGLLSVDSSGNQNSVTVNVQIDYSPAGLNTWTRIPLAGGTQTFSPNWLNSSGGTFNTIAFNGKSTSALRFGVSWKTPARGKYDVRISRLTADSTSDTVQDVVTWTALRRIELVDPINSPVPVAKTAIRIKATDQLNGVVDNFTGYPTLVALDWDSGSSSWILRPTQSPAAAFRAALQGNGLQVPYVDADIDLDFISYWSERCEFYGFKYNQVRDFTSSVWDLLCDIAAAGRASPTNVDGKWSVVIDEPKTPVQYITPRNSSGFHASKLFADVPHAIRVQFNNEQADFVNDEVRVYLNGYTAETATKFETMEFPGITDPDLVTKAARFAATCAIQRPEIWAFSQDMERLVYRRGDLVNITHDVLLVGLAYGRLKSVILDVDGNAIGVTVDENLPMEDGKSYTMAIRAPSNVNTVVNITAVAGDNLTAMFVTPIVPDFDLATDYLFGFGESGLENDVGIILTIDPTDTEGYNADITAVPYRSLVYDIDAGPIPPFNSLITPPTPLPDVQIVGIRTDETVLTIQPGGALAVHAAVKVQPISIVGARLDVQIEPSIPDAIFSQAQVDSTINNEVFIGNLATGEYVDIRLRWIVPGRQPGNWSYAYNTLIVGNSNPPQPLQNLNLATFGGQAFLRWDQPSELDVLFGGNVAFRHSTDPFPQWVNSTSIGDTTRAKNLIATLPLKPGTYLGRVFDVSGNQSTVVSVDTKQASVLTYAPVNTVDEAPLFLGTKTSVLVDGIFLKIDGTGDWDSISDVDAEPTDVDSMGGVLTASAGIYDFEQGFDFGSVQLIRLTTRLNAFNAPINDNIDTWLSNIDTRPDFDGDDNTPCDCNIYVSQTDDDPANPAAIWTPFQRLDSMEVEARGCKFRAILTSTNRDYNIFVEEMGIDAEKVT